MNRIEKKRPHRVLIKTDGIFLWVVCRFTARNDLCGIDRFSVRKFHAQLWSRLKLIGPRRKLSPFADDNLSFNDLATIKKRSVLKNSWSHNWKLSQSPNKKPFSIPEGETFIAKKPFARVRRKKERKFYLNDNTSLRRECFIVRMVIRNYWPASYGHSISLGKKGAEPFKLT